MQCGVGDVWQKVNSRLCESRRHLGPRTQSFSTASAQKRRPLLSQCQMHGPFLPSWVTAGHEIESEAEVCQS